ncbi:MAG: restriction endonuclease [FCB group bacterium]|nr:restriction endonuclease [FCB group bacterium]
MEIPDFQSIMLPLLRFASDRQEHSLRETIEALAEVFHLAQAEREQLLPSGRQPIFDNRVGWASSYLRKAGLIESPRRGVLVLTEQGQKVLTEPLDRITVKYLDRFDGFREFREASRKDSIETPAASDNANDSTPEESLEFAYQRLRAELALELLTRVKDCSSVFFERLVVELLVAMGYGGSLKDAGERVGKSGDGGIDGIIKEDRLGLDAIYLQAKRWEGTVGRPEIQKFVGALQGQRARKGVFITTSDFTKEARDYATNIDLRVILVDGQQLAQLMIDYNIGVSTVTAYAIKRADTDYFTE